MLSTPRNSHKIVSDANRDRERCLFVRYLLLIFFRNVGRMAAVTLIRQAPLQYLQ